jgi:L-fuculokinase
VKKLALVIDCGATSVRAAAVDDRGRIVHLEARPNAAVRQKPGSEWLVWDLEDIWKKMLLCSSAVVRRSGGERFAAVTVTSFSDDGAPFDRDRNMLYPVISWQCARTVPVAESIGDRIDPRLLFRVTGEQPLHQHTLFRLLWLREHEPRVFARMRGYLMFPGIINRRLTGETVNDPTTGDSMMLMDIRTRAYSPRLLGLCGLDASYFPPLVVPGTVIGALLPRVARSMGLKNSPPVVAAGHDTQFAIYGSGCAPGGATLSSGTWEILFMRTGKPLTSAMAYNGGIKNECDAETGVYDCGTQWVGAGVLEWLKARMCRNDATALLREAAMINPGCGGLAVLPSFMPGPCSPAPSSGSIMGLNLQTSEAEIYRAALEGLSFTLRAALERIERASKKKIPGLIVVGGGSANDTWNRIRASVLGRPVYAAAQKESTILGAAMFAFAGAGFFRSPGEARAAFNLKARTVEPGPDRGAYAELYGAYQARIRLLRKC